MESSATKDNGDPNGRLTLYATHMLPSFGMAGTGYQDGLISVLGRPFQGI